MAYDFAQLVFGIGLKVVDLDRFAFQQNSTNDRTPTRLEINTF
jgi:hypothetical protein